MEATKIQIHLSDRYSLRLHFNHPLRHRRLLGFWRPTPHPLQRFLSSSPQRMAHHGRRFDAYSPGFFISFQISISSFFSLFFFSFSSLTLRRTLRVQFITFGFACTPLYFVWEKVIGMHETKSMCLRALARLPVVIPIWFLAIIFPFFGPINSAVGALLVSFTVYIIPSLAHMLTFRSASARQVNCLSPFIFLFHCFNYILPNTRLSNWHCRILVLKADV